jgi:hypothetical protein
MTAGFPLIRPADCISLRARDAGIVSEYLDDIVSTGAGMMIAGEHSVATP